MLRGEVFVGVEDDLVGSGGAGEGGLLFGGDGGEDAGAEGLCHLDEEEADAAGSGVDEDFVAGPDGVGGVGEVVGGHALEHGSGGLLEGDGVGDVDEAVGGGDGELGVGSGDAAPGDAVAGLDGGDVYRRWRRRFRRPPGRGCRGVWRDSGPRGSRRR